MSSTDVTGCIGIFPVFCTHARNIIPQITKIKIALRKGQENWACALSEEHRCL